MKKRERINFFILLVLTLSGFLSFFGPPVNAQEEDVQFVIGIRQGTIWPLWDPDLGEGTVPYAQPYWALESLYWTEQWTSDDYAFEVVPWLVESELLTNDGATVTLTLRDNVTFWNGQPWNASVLEWNLDRYANLGLTFWGQQGHVGAQSWIQRLWPDIDSFLGIADNIKYNNSVNYPHIWWNKPDSRYPPEQWDGTNQSAMAAYSGNESDLQWPQDWRQWRGRPVWTPEPCFDYATNTNITRTGNFPGNNRNTNMMMPPHPDWPKGYMVDPADPMKLIWNLSMPVWVDAKLKLLDRLPMKFPDGSWNASIGYWNYDGPMLSFGDSYPANADGNLATKEELLEVIGTGMMMMDSIDPVEEIYTWKKNPNYWGGDWEATGRPGPIDPKFDTLVLKNYQDEAAYYAATLAKEFDMMWNQGPSAPDYWPAIEADPDLTLMGPFPTKSSQYFIIKRSTDEYIAGIPPVEMGVNKTLRHAMSFAFDYYGYMESVSGGNLIRAGGPGSPGLLYTRYPNGNQRIYPDQIDENGTAINGFHYNLTHARKILIDSGATGSRGLTLASTDLEWLGVANGLDPIANISVMGHTSNPLIFTNLQTFFERIGINVTEYGPIADANQYPYEWTENRWAKDVWYHSMTYNTPHWFDPYKWFWDDFQQVDLFDKDNHQLCWNSASFESTLVELTDDDLYYVRTQLGDPGYEPTTRNFRDLMMGLQCQLEVASPNITQLQYDVDTMLDYIYDDAQAIWVSTFAGRNTVKTSRWSIPEWWTVNSGGGNGIWDFGYLSEPGGEEPDIVIPGFQLEIILGTAVLALVILTLTTKKKRM